METFTIALGPTQVELLRELTEWHNRWQTAAIAHSTLTPREPVTLEGILHVIASVAIHQAHARGEHVFTQDAQPGVRDG